jgi:hypothetical protein
MKDARIWYKSMRIEIEWTCVFILGGGVVKILKRRACSLCALTQWAEAGLSLGRTGDGDPANGEWEERGHPIRGRFLRILFFRRLNMELGVG